MTIRGTVTAGVVVVATAATVVAWSFWILLGLRANGWFPLAFVAVQALFVVVSVVGAKRLELGGRKRVLLASVCATGAVNLLSLMFLFGYVGPSPQPPG